MQKSSANFVETVTAVEVATEIRGAPMEIEDHHIMAIEIKTLPPTLPPTRLSTPTIRLRSWESVLSRVR